MTEDEILASLSLLPRGPGWVVVSGGNPALHELGTLCKRITRDLNLRIAVETQGTRYKPWLREVHRLCLSPKPPSSTMAFDEDAFQEFLREVLEGREYHDAWTGNVFIKVVVFDSTDYAWAKKLFFQVSEWSGGVGLPFYLSAGNDAGVTVGNPGRVDERSVEKIRSDLLSRYLWLINRTMIDPEWQGEVTVQSQMHVLAWGNQQGV